MRGFGPNQCLIQNSALVKPDLSPNTSYLHLQENVCQRYMEPIHPVFYTGLWGFEPATTQFRLKSSALPKQVVCV